MPEPLVTLTGVTKTYAGITALSDVSFSIAAGEAVCLPGENGSGKSTLIKILAGVERPDRGTIAFGGRVQGPLNPRAAAEAGIKVIFQDFSLFPNLTVAENIAFYAELSAHTRLVRRARMRALAAQVLERIGVEIPLEMRVENLSVAHKQLVAIARALATRARLLIMDEPTTALTEREVQRLLDIIRLLKSEGVAVLFVSHKLSELLEVSEHVVVLRNGEKVAEGPADEFDAASLTRHMTGRDLAADQPAAVPADAPVLMEVTALTRAGAFEDVSFRLRAGEVLGIAGLLGSGRTALAKGLFGLVAPESGAITLDGRPVELGDTIAAAAAGLGYVPEDRLTEGLFLTQSVLQNIGIGRLEAHANGAGVLDLAGLGAEARDWIARLKVKAPDPEAPVRALSGGNQQRVVLARWMARSPRVLILNGPTVGVDVGSKAEIHAIIADLAAHGLGVIVISDDLPEVLATCSRILVMKSGRIVADLQGGTIDETELAHRLAS